MSHLLLIPHKQVLTEEQHEKASNNEYNFDHPDAFDLDLLVETLARLKSGKKVEIPVYNFTTHSREKQTVSARALSSYLFNNITLTQADVHG